MCMHRAIAGVLCIQTGEITPVSGVLTCINVFGRCTRIPPGTSMCCTDYGVVYAYINEVEFDIELGVPTEIYGTRYLSGVNTIVSKDLKGNEWEYSGCTPTVNDTDMRIFCEKGANIPTVMVGCKLDRLFMVYIMNETGIWKSAGRTCVDYEVMADVTYHNRAVYILCTSRRLLSFDMASANPAWSNVYANLPNSFEYETDVHICMSNNIMYACRVIRTDRLFQTDTAVIYRQAREADYTAWIETRSPILPVTLSDDYMVRMCDVDGIVTLIIVSSDFIVLATYRYDIDTNSWNLVE